MAAVYNESKARLEANRKRFEELLRSTGREGVDDCLDELSRLGFFEAPASTRFHLCREGGLLEHSLNTCDAALKIRDDIIELDPSTAAALTKESVIISALLHDVCKADIYKPVVKRVKDQYGNWKDAPGFDVDYSHFPIGHGEKSVIVTILAGLALTNDEMLAMRWHMAAWDVAFQNPETRSNINQARLQAPLCSVLQAADTIAANILEHAQDED